jgi:hypothetical protein
MQQYTNEVEELVSFAVGFGILMGALGSAVVFFIVARVLGLP